MPWRTLVEVAVNLNAGGLHKVAICSGQSSGGTRKYQGVTIYSIPPDLNALKQKVEDEEWEAVYYPISYRQALKSLNGLAGIPAKMIAYIPGGLCPLSGSMKLIRLGHWHVAKPYLLDTLTPHKILFDKLKKAGIKKIICQSPLTAFDAIKHGFDEDGVVMALPGKDKIEETDDSLVRQLGLSGKRFLLFSGAPSPARGALTAIRAFDRVAGSLGDVKLVMLMRKDTGSDFGEIEAALAKIRHRHQVLLIYDRISRVQLMGMFKAAYAALLPFLIIPSEIPLTFFEMMSLGTPVLTFENGGTTNYLASGLKIAIKRSEKSLGKAIVEICNDRKMRDKLSESAVKLMSKHPGWKQTAERWERALR